MNGRDPHDIRRHLVEVRPDVNCNRAIIVPVHSRFYSPSSLAPCAELHNGLESPP